MTAPALPADPQTLAPSRGFAGRAAAALALSFRYALPLVALASAFAALSLAASLWRLGAADVDFLAFASLFLRLVLPAFALMLLVVRFLHMLVAVRPKRPLRWFADDMKGLFLSPERLILALPAALAMTVFINAYTAFKANIPLLLPFAYDVPFSDLDRLLHFGVDPWRLLHPLLGFPVVTFAVNAVYNLWFFVMWAVWTCAAFQRRPRAADMRFLFAFMLCWCVGGGALALLFSSAGPAFFADLGLAPDPYAPLMSYLNAADARYPVLALDVQRALWAGYRGEQDAIVGISAMPSLHNASALLFALWARRAAPKLFWPLVAFSAFIFIGSVHLAWHYAVDAYVGWLVAWAAWWAAGRLVGSPTQTELRRRLAERLDAL